MPKMKVNGKNTNKHKILIVDDEGDITLSFKRILEIYGFTVDAFNDSTVALSEFKKEYYDLALIDIKMPQLDGFDLYKQLKELDPELNIFFLTASEAYYEQYRRKDYSKLSRDLFIQKPIELKDLLERINNALK
jgi:DNA-binding response OmpR family regulator